ncbi:MAG TPA: response regulator [Opitutaceae bacterium]|nr:response regulator [Opitutaceae bacterium]
MSTDAKIALLIAEDDQNLRTLMEAAARHAGGFDPIVTAPDGQAALDAVRNGAVHPDLIVTDLSMPRMTGIELIRALKRDPATRAIPVAVVTSSDIANDREDALVAGAQSFWAKPHGFDALIALLNGIRESCRALTAH